MRVISRRDLETLVIHRNNQLSLPNCGLAILTRQATLGRIKIKRVSAESLQPVLVNSGVLRQFRVKRQCQVSVLGDHDDFIIAAGQYFNVFTEIGHARRADEVCFEWFVDGVKVEYK